MQRYVITGGTGHLGNNVIKMLTEDKESKKIIALLLPGEDLTPIKDFNVEIKYGDVRDKEFLRSNIKSGDYVIHMAGIIDINSSKNPLMYDVNVNGTKNIADVCLENKAKKLVYTSSVHAIDPYETDGPMKEPTKFEPDALIGEYSKTKAIAASYVFDKVKEGLNAVVVYPSGIIGPRDYKVSNIGQVFINLSNGKLPAYMKGQYNFVDVRDCAQGVINALKMGVSGEGYLLTGEIINISDLMGVFAKVAKRRKPPKVPLWLVKFSAFVVQKFYEARKRKPVLCTYSIEVLGTNCNFDNSKAEKEIGLKMRNINDSLREQAEWLLENHPELFKKNKELYKANKLKQKQTKKTLTAEPSFAGKKA